MDISYFFYSSWPTWKIPEYWNWNLFPDDRQAQTLFIRVREKIKRDHHIIILKDRIIIYYWIIIFAELVLAPIVIVMSFKLVLKMPMIMDLNCPNNYCNKLYFHSQCANHKLMQIVSRKSRKRNTKEKEKNMIFFHFTVD